MICSKAHFNSLYYSYYCLPESGLTTTYEKHWHKEVCSPISECVPIGREGTHGGADNQVNWNFWGERVGTCQIRIWFYIMMIGSGFLLLALIIGLVKLCKYCLLKRANSSG